jgi:hypothetical protein
LEPIQDLSWIAQAAGGETLERFELSGYSVVSILVSARADHRNGTYRYRMLFSEKNDRRPVYAVNLESSILGEWIITEQIGKEHRILHRLPSVADYERFRVLALDRAVAKLAKKP